MHASESTTPLEFIHPEGFSSTSAGQVEWALECLTCLPGSPSVCLSLSVLLPGRASLNSWFHTISQALSSAQVMLCYLPIPCTGCGGTWVHCRHVGNTDVCAVHLHYSSNGREAASWRVAPFSHTLCQKWLLCDTSDPSFKPGSPVQTPLDCHCSYWKSSD